MNIILEVVLPTFAIIAIGFLVGKLKKKLDIDTLIFLIMYLSAPALAFSSIYENEIILNDFIAIAVASTATILGIWGIAVITFRLFKIKHTALYLPMMFGNNGYMGYPVIMFAYGLAGFSRAVLYVIVMSIVLYSLGIYIAHRKGGFKEIFRLPLIYTVAAAIIVKSLSITLPTVIIKPLTTVGLITVPAALIVLGYQLSSIKLSSTGYGVLGTAYRIGLGFLISLLVVTLLGITGITKNVIIVEGAMPAAIMSLIITHRYNKKDADLVASVVMVSTLVSIITIPLILGFLG